MVIIYLEAGYQYRRARLERQWDKITNWYDKSYSERTGTEEVEHRKLANDYAWKRLSEDVYADFELWKVDYVVSAEDGTKLVYDRIDKIIEEELEDERN